MGHSGAGRPRSYPKGHPVTRRPVAAGRNDDEVSPLGTHAESAIQIDGPWTHRSVTANGTRFHVASCGDGPLVLLLHGFPEFWWTWRNQLTALSAAGFR